MKYAWTMKSVDLEQINRLAGELSISSLLAQCLLNRGIGLKDVAEAQAFLDPRLMRLSDPFALPNMERAVTRLFEAREKDQPIVVFGDYDVDGITSTAILLEVLGRLGWTVNHYLPNRLGEGYGFSQEAVQKCLGRFEVGLFLAVDCGSTSFDTVQWLKTQSIDVLVLDHHQLCDPHPPAYAIVNPQIRAMEEGVPSYYELCSAGLSFKLAHALVKRGRNLELPGFQDFDLKVLLDLVALGTVADLVPLVGENRNLVRSGLDRLSWSARPGIQALKKVAQVNGEVGVYETGFLLAPRLNAAGRLEDANLALDLILSPSVAQAEGIAHQLDSRNRERQGIEQAISDQVLEKVRARFDPKHHFIIVEGSQDWHIGVVGIVASRVVREFHRPTILIGHDNGEWRGSGRSVEGFDLAHALRGCSELLDRHGGHAMAAGLALSPDRIDTLRDRLNEVARNELTPQQLTPKLRLDAEVHLGDMTLDRLQELGQLQPTGMNNPNIQFMVRRVRFHRPPMKMGREKQHLKIWLEQDQDVHEAVWWNWNGKETPKDWFDLAFSPQINHYNGKTSVQLKWLDWRVE